jgi:hypothetical protein
MVSSLEWESMDPKPRHGSCGASLGECVRDPIGFYFVVVLRCVLFSFRF